MPIKVAIDTKCSCGWLLPHAVMPMRNVPGAVYGEDAIMPDAVVTLNCPVCHSGHMFASVHEAAKRNDRIVGPAPGFRARMHCNGDSCRSILCTCACDDCFYVRTET
jgi:hypothetical protein